MKMIIAGYREMIPTNKHVEILDSYKHLITEVVSGCARGADKFGESWAEYNKIPIKYFPADWEKYGKKAGVARNAEMSIYGEGLIAFLHSKCIGTRNMIKQAEKLNLWMKIVDLENENISS
jgi:hypothetical protein